MTAAQAAHFNMGLLDATSTSSRLPEPLGDSHASRRPPDGDRVPVVQPSVHHYRHGVHGQHGQAVGRGDGAGAGDAHGAQVGVAPLVLG